MAQSVYQSQKREVREDVSVCFDSSTLLWVPFRVRELPQGLMHRPLRRLDDGSLRSAILRVPAGWSSGGNTQLKQRIQLYVLSGSLRIGDRVFEKDTYICHHGGLILSDFGSGELAEVLIVCDGPPAFERTPDPADDLAIVVEDVPAKGTTRLWKTPSPVRPCLTCASHRVGPAKGPSITPARRRSSASPATSRRTESASSGPAGFCGTRPTECTVTICTPPSAARCWNGTTAPGPKSSMMGEEKQAARAVSAPSEKVPTGV